MDAEKLPEALKPSQLAPPAAGSSFSCLEQCVPWRCRPACALEVVDGLLGQGGAITGAEADCLLDLRQLLLTRREAESTLRMFCELRRQLERRHYLDFYRLRRWLENHIIGELRPCPGAMVMPVALRLNGHCLEAVRRWCLCAALGQGVSLSAPRLHFAFLSLPKPTDTGGQPE